MNFYLGIFFILLAVLTLFSSALGFEENLLVRDLSSFLKPEKLHLIEEVQEIDLKLSDNVWLKKYSSFEAHNYVLDELKNLQNSLDKLKRLPKTQQNNQKIQQLQIEIDSLTRSLDLLDVDRENPFKELLDKPEITNVPLVSNPFLIVSALGFLKNLDAEHSELKSRVSALLKTLGFLEKKRDLLLEIQSSIMGNPKELESLRSSLGFWVLQTQNRIFELQGARKILQTTDEVFEKSYQDTRHRVKGEIKTQVLKLLGILIAIAASFALALLFKAILRKYLGEGERSYIACRVINFIHITLVVFILVFSYLDNVAYLVTFLGFASAGLAIAMKDLFMSLLGWFVIATGGSIRINDRIRVSRDGSDFIGDVLNISMLRITIYEDVTLHSLQDKRAGRIIFIPNHYIFTAMIANYTHGGLKSIWDAVDCTLTFDSNIAKAKEIAKNIAFRHCNAEVAKLEFKKLKTRYGIKVPDLSVRVFVMMESSGVRLVVWYLTHVYSAMSTKSEVSFYLTQSFLKEPDIHIAYNTTRLVKDGRDGFGNKVANIFPIET